MVPVLVEFHGVHVLFEAVGEESGCIGISLDQSAQFLFLLY